MSKSSAKVSLIESIDDSTDRWRVVARVLRRWNVFQKDSPTEVVAVSMLLADELVRLIYCVCILYIWLRSEVMYGHCH